jgi:hypothetical protein
MGRKLKYGEPTEQTKLPKSLKSIIIGICVKYANSDDVKKVGIKTSLLKLGERN